MNVQDALGIVGQQIEQTREQIGQTEETREFLVEAEGLLITTIGTENLETQKFGQAIAKVAHVQMSLGNLLSEQEELQGILANIL